MTTAEKDQHIGNLVEQKILEFFGDPDAGLTLKKSFASKLRKRLGTSQKLISNTGVAKKYGIR